MSESKCKYQMIDFNDTDGQLYISIYLGSESFSDVKLLFKNRKNNNTHNIPVKIYGQYAEAVISLDIFSSHINKNEEIFDSYWLVDNRQIEPEICKENYIKTQYWPLLSNFYKAKAYINGFEKLSIYFVYNEIEVNLKSFEMSQLISKIEIELQTELHKNHYYEIAEYTLLFKKRKQDLEIRAEESSELSINFEKSKEKTLLTEIDFEKLFSQEMLGDEKIVYDGYIRIRYTDYSYIDVPLSINLDDKFCKYKKIYDDWKICWFLNYIGAISICTNTIKKGT